MSQVKNLRAMFENNTDANSPDRGRSPSVSGPGRSNIDTNSDGSPRPLSKVRTNFVAIEKGGRIGLRMDRAEHSPARPDGSGDITSNADLDSTLSEVVTSGMSAERPATRHDPNNKIQASEGASSAPITGNPTNAADAIVGEPVDTHVNIGTSTSKDTEGKPSSTKRTSKAAGNSGQPPRTNHPSSKKIFTSSTAASSKATKSTTHTTQQLASGPKRTALAQGRSAATQQPSSSQPVSMMKRAKPSTTKSQGSTRGAMEAPVDGGFVKPKPKSPTKPLRLPTSLTAPTASSVSKVAGPRQSLSRQSVNAQTATAASARTSLSASATSKAKVQRHGADTSRPHPRPSIGPPPAKAPRDDANSKITSNVDSSFLARMTRPTQSSSSRTAEKGASTPPKGSTTKPRTTGRTSSKPVVTKARQSNVQTNLQAEEVVATAAVPSRDDGGTEGEDTLLDAPAATPQSLEGESMHHTDTQLATSWESSAEGAKDAITAPVQEAESSSRQEEAEPAGREKTPPEVATQANVDCPEVSSVEVGESSLKESAKEPKAVTEDGDMAQTACELATAATSREMTDTTVDAAPVSVLPGNFENITLEGTVPENDDESRAPGLSDIVKENHATSHSMPDNQEQQNTQSDCVANFQGLDLDEGGHGESREGMGNVGVSSDAEPVNLELPSGAELGDQVADGSQHATPVQPESDEGPNARSEDIPGDATLGERDLAVQP